MCSGLKTSKNMLNILNITFCNNENWIKWKKNNNWSIHEYVDNDIRRTHTDDDSCWKPPLLSVPIRSFSRHDPGRIHTQRLQNQLAESCLTSLYFSTSTGWGRSQTCRWFQSHLKCLRVSNQPQIPVRGSPLCYFVMLDDHGTHTNYPSSCIRVMSHEADERVQVSPLAYHTGTRQKAHVDSYVCLRGNK